MSEDKVDKWREAENEFQALLDVMLDMRAKDLAELKQATPDMFPGLAAYAGGRDLSDGHEDLKALIALEQEIDAAYKALEHAYQVEAGQSVLGKVDVEALEVDALAEQYKQACGESSSKQLPDVMETYIEGGNPDKLKAAYQAVLDDNLPHMDDLSKDAREALEVKIHAYQEATLNDVDGFIQAHPPTPTPQEHVKLYQDYKERMDAGASPQTDIEDAPSDDEGYTPKQ